MNKEKHAELIDKLNHSDDGKASLIAGPALVHALFRMRKKRWHTVDPERQDMFHTLWKSNLPKDQKRAIFYHPRRPLGSLLV